MPKTKAADGKETLHPTRLEVGKKAGAEPPLPPLRDRTLFDWLMEAGPTRGDSMGRYPLTWEAIDAWKRNTGRTMDAWDFTMLQRLSKEYLIESQQAEDPNRPAPWRPEGLIEVDHEALERMHDAAFG